MLPKTGRKLPLWKGVLGGREAYARTIAELLRKEHGDAAVEVMRTLKASLDPDNIMNPGKVLDA